MKTTFQRIWGVISTILVVLIVLIAVFLVAIRIAGLRAYTVMSGSMEPEYHVGALLFVKPADAQSIRPGDAITFLAGEDVIVTHRVTEVIPDAEDAGVVRFRTKGDANNAEDATLVHSSNLIGKAAFSVPLLGYAANYIQHPPGTYVAIAAAVVIILLAFWPSGEKKKKSEEKSDEKTPQ